MSTIIKQSLVVSIAIIAIAFAAYAQNIYVTGDVMIQGGDSEEANLGATINRLPATKRVGTEVLPRVAGDDICLSAGTNCLSTAGGGSFTGDLNDISDVSTTSPTNYGDLLMWNGSDWTNSATSSLGIVGTTFASIADINSALSGETVASTTASLSVFTDDLGLNIVNWDTAYGWGDWSGEGFITASTTNLTVSNSAWVDNTLYINQICNSAGECFDSPSAEGSAISFYPANTEADIATYENMYTIPTVSTPIDESCSADSDIDGGYCLIDAYISTTTDINILNYPAGTTEIHAYSYVNSNVGVSSLVFKGYKRDTAGTETLLGTATTTEINGDTTKEYTTIFTGGADYPFNVDGTDRLVMKVYGHTTSGVAKTIHWTYQDSALYSHIVTPITSADLGHARIYADETITGTWTFSLDINGNLVGTASGNDVLGQATSTLASHTTTYDHDNYDTAYSWGDWSGEDFAGITLSDISNWDTAYGWGDWSGEGFLTAVSSDTTWTDHNSYPSACSAGQYVSAIGDTLTCSAPTNTTYTAGGTLLDLTGTTFSINEGTLTDTKYCTYEDGTGIECNSEGGGGVTGSTGQVAYLSGTDTAVGTSTITIDTNENVGIGSTSPMAKLVVDDGVTGTSTIQFGDASNPLCFAVGTTAGTVMYLWLEGDGSWATSTSACNE